MLNNHNSKKGGEIMFKVRLCYFKLFDSDKVEIGVSISTETQEYIMDKNGRMIDLDEVDKSNDITGGTNVDFAKAIEYEEFIRKTTRQEISTIIDKIEENLEELSTRMVVVEDKDSNKALQNIFTLTKTLDKVTKQLPP